MNVIEVVLGVLVGGFFAATLMHWVLSRITAERCPRCQSQWQTDYLGDRIDEEEWVCRSCGHAWGVPCPIPHD